MIIINIQMTPLLTLSPLMPRSPTLPGIPYKISKTVDMSNRYVNLYHTVIVIHVPVRCLLVFLLGQLDQVGPKKKKKIL